MTTVRAYRQADWPRLCEVHDAARRDELAASVGVEAFLTLEQTWGGEGLLDGDLWVAERDDTVVGFLALAGDEVTWMYVLDGNHAARSFYEREGFVVESTTTGRLAGNEAFAATGHTMVRTRPPVS